MLRELRIRNLAVIESLTVPFGPGLNVLTGETGAGKSILIDALTLLLGERAQPAETIDLSTGSAVSNLKAHSMICLPRECRQICICLS